MRRVVAAISLACVIALTAPAQARGHHHRSHHRSHTVHHSDGRPSAWCGWWMRQHTGIKDQSLNLARNWTRVGSAIAAPVVGAIGVMSHHVFQVVKVVGHGKVLAISGNDGHAVRTRVRSTRGVIAWRLV